MRGAMTARELAEQIDVPDYAAAYRPCATRTKLGAGLPTSAASAQLTEFGETSSPTSASTAAWMSATRIGPP